MKDNISKTKKFLTKLGLEKLTDATGDMNSRFILPPHGKNCYIKFV
jgi:hypothetical protein